MKNHELLCRLALTQLPGIGIAGAHKLLDATEGKVAMLLTIPRIWEISFPAFHRRSLLYSMHRRFCGVVKQSFRSQKKSYSLSYL